MKVCAPVSLKITLVSLNITQYGPNNAPIILACVWLALNDENIKTIRSKCLQSYCYGEVAIVESLLRENIHTCMDHLAEQQVSVVEMWTLVEIVTL